jgi:hypothetical protein
MNGEKMKKFDYIIGNPPYLGMKELYIKIINKIYPLGDEITMIHPNVPYFNKNPKKSVFTEKFLFNIQNHNQKIIIKTIDVSIFLPATFTNGLCITHIKKDKTNKTNKTKTFDYVGYHKSFTNIPIEYITDLNKLEIHPIMYRKCVEYFKSINTESFSSIIEKDNNKCLENKGCYFHLSLIRGNTKRTGEPEEHYFTCFTSERLNSSYKQKGIRLGAKCEYHQIENIAKYLETKFARFAFALKKFDFNIKKSSFEYVPLVDFNKEYTDEELFKIFDTPLWIQKLIMKMPDNKKNNAIDKYNRMYKNKKG